MTKAIRTHLMFLNGQAKRALDRYQEVFDDFVVDHIETYRPDDGPEGQVKLARFTLAGAQFSCIDSPIEHDFDMTPAVSLFVECSDAQELERLFDALSRDGEVLMPLDDYGFSTRFGWVNDCFAVSWQLNLE